MFPNPSFQAYAQGQGTTPTGSFVIEQRDPNPNDIYYPIGKFWINQTDVRLWYLNQQSNVITATNPTGALQSTWELISVSSLLVSISDDGNTPVFPSLNSDTPPDNIQLKAGTGISIVGTPASHLITISATGAGAESLQGNDGVTVGPDGSGIIHTIGGTTIYVTGNAGTFTETFDVVTNNHALLVGRGATTAAVPLAVGNTNTVLLGNTGADPSFGQVPNAALVNSSVTLNNGNNITVTGGTPLSLGGVASFDLTGTTNHAIQLGNASGSLTSASPLTNGQLLIGSAGVDPVASTLTAGTGITITNGAGSITIAVDGSTVVEGVTGDDGLNVVPSAGFITLDGVTVVNATNAKPVFFKRNAASTEELDVQLTTTSTSGAKNINKSGLAHFDSASFTVDAATGFVSLSTGADVTGLVMDAGTSPVVPDGSGHITITGAQVATGVVGANVIRSDGTGANTLPYKFKDQRFPLFQILLKMVFHISIHLNFL